MYKLLNFILLVLALSSCKSDKQVPDNILPKDKMVLLIRDLHLVEAYINANFTYSDSSKFLFKNLEDSIFKAHQTSPVAFDSSMAYYQRNIKDMDEIYAVVVDSLSLMEGTAK